MPRPKNTGGYPCEACGKQNINRYAKYYHKTICGKHLTQLEEIARLTGIVEQRSVMVAVANDVGIDVGTDCNDFIESSATEVHDKVDNTDGDRYKTITVKVYENHVMSVLGKEMLEIKGSPTLVAQLINAFNSVKM